MATGAEANPDVNILTPGTRVSPSVYTLSNANFWLTLQLQSRNALLPLSNIECRKKILFENEWSIPMQVIRYGGPEGEFCGCVTLSALSPSAIPPGAPSVEEIGGKVELVELGYYLSEKHRGKGIVQAATRRLIEYAREEFGLDYVYGSANITNAKSSKIMSDLAKEYVEEREREVKAKVWVWSIGGRESESGSGEGEE
ncbi:hypothetical protein NHQ30_001890 [Ciborinia camelliae]|nr:hypothetical protein NHQ30_001890 [Ciborinia camelliae]